MFRTSFLACTVLVAVMFTHSGRAADSGATKTKFESQPAGAPAQNGRIFVASFMTMHDPFFVKLRDGIRKAVEAHGDRLLFSTASTAGKSRNASSSPPWSKIRRRCS